MKFSHFVYMFCLLSLHCWVLFITKGCHNATFMYSFKLDYTFIHMDTKMDNIDESKFIWWFKLSYIKMFDFFLFIKIDGNQNIRYFKEY